MLKGLLLVPVKASFADTLLSGLLLPTDLRGQVSLWFVVVVCFVVLVFV